MTTSTLKRRWSNQSKWEDESKSTLRVAFLSIFFSCYSEITSFACTHWTLPVTISCKSRRKTLITASSPNSETKVNKLVAVLPCIALRRLSILTSTAQQTHVHRKLHENDSCHGCTACMSSHLSQQIKVVSRSKVIETKRGYYSDPTLSFGSLYPSIMLSQNFRKFAFICFVRKLK